MTDLDPVVRARFFLNTIRNKPDTMIVYITVPALRALANTVIDLTDKVEQLEELADRLEWEADPDNHGGEWDHFLLAIVDRIRDTLNGETA